MTSRRAKWVLLSASFALLAAIGGIAISQANPMLAKCAAERRGPLSFAAEFDHPLNLPDATFLNHYRMWGNLRTLAGNKEAEVYIDPAMAAQYGATNPFSFGDGLLRIRADKAPAALKSALGGDYSSGMITTEASFAQRYGVFEIRAKAPTGKGLWPAFWLVGKTSDAHYEIDAMEILGHEPGTLYQSTHGPDKSYEFHEKAQLQDPGKFHVYSVEWRPDVICFRVDGAATNATANKFDTPMYMIANLAVGGSWPGYPDRDTVFPAEFLIDYVRVYQLAH